MKRRIYRNIFIITLLSIFAATVICIFGFYNLFAGQMSVEIKHEAYVLEKALNYVDDNTMFLDYLGLAASDDRITVISEHGFVIYDSYEYASLMDDHSNRPEVIDAIQYGFGEDKRYSSTLGKETYYYAVKLNNGNILRVSKTVNNLTGVFLSVMPFIIVMSLIVLALTNFISVRLTKRIIEPLNKIDAEQDDLEIYDELSPFVNTIYKQREQLRSQLDSLHRRSEMISAILDSMREGLILLDKDAVVISANSSAIKALADYSGITAEEKHFYEGKNILELTRDIEFIENVKSSVEGKNCYNTIEIKNRTFQLFFNPVANIGAIVLFFDITEKALAEKIRVEFSANVSHELRTPLTTALGYIEMIDDGMVREESIPLFVRKVRTEISRLIVLTEDITKLSELDEATGQKDFEKFDIRIVADSVVERLSAAASEKSISVCIRGGRFNVFANKTMIDELIFNVVDNAIKYNNVGGNVDVVISDKNGFVEIKVLDTGIGIPSEHLDRIFERFYRVDKSRSKKTGGTGLGLSIVKHIALYHNGSVSVESEEGVGTVMTILLDSLQ